MKTKSLLLECYRLCGVLLAPVAVLLCLWRLVRGQEERARIGERFGFAKQSRPSGRLIWFHGASIGEVVALLPLVHCLLERDANLQVLITSTTRGSSTVLHSRMPARCIHQYVPYDYPGAVRRFLSHWRPDLAVWTESELWPHLILHARARGISMAQVSAYMSATSFRRWNLAPHAARMLLESFSMCLARDEAASNRLSDLLGRKIDGIANLKEVTLVLPFDADELAALQECIGNRPCWLATNTHEGEEEMLARAHQRLRSSHPDLLLILAPRRVERMDAVVRVLEREGCGRVQLRSQTRLPQADSSFYVVDSFGELGLFYQMFDMVFLGGSLTSQGGHNPLEPARSGCFVLHGGHVTAYAYLFKSLDAQGGGACVSDEGALADAVSKRLRDASLLKGESAAAKRFALDLGGGMVDDVATRLLALMDS